MAPSNSERFFRLSCVHINSNKFARCAFTNTHHIYMHAYTHTHKHIHNGIGNGNGNRTQKHADPDNFWY